jgi:uncharacterized repeat protein (TIGR01451 family)
MKNFITSLSRRGNKAKLLVAAITAITAITGATVFAGYGPNGGERKIFDFSNSTQREGAFDAPRFNSYINTNVYGDERAFVDAKECAAASDACYTQGQAGGYKDKQPVEPGKEYIIRAYVHNIANPSINNVDRDNDGHSDGVARNTRIRFEMPNGTANGFTMQARITADNAIPKMVYDTVDLKNENTAFNIDYVPGSAMIYNAANPNGHKLGDDIMSGNGALIGHDKMNGKIPGCFEFASFVVIRVKVSAPELTVVKQVRKAGEKQWQESVSSKPGDNVQWLVHVKNTGSTVQNNVSASDLLPPHLDYVGGTAKWYSKSQNGVAYDFNQFTINQGKGGYIFGNYAPKGDFLVRFDTKVKDDFKQCSIVIRNVAYARSKESPKEQQDHADVKITKEDCKPAEKPDVTPEKPTTLPVTGVGSALGIFAGTSTLGAVLHRLWIRRFGRGL